MHVEWLIHISLLSILGTKIFLFLICIRVWLGNCGVCVCPLICWFFCLSIIISHNRFMLIFKVRLVHNLYMWYSFLLKVVLCSSISLYLCHRYLSTIYVHACPCQICIISVLIDAVHMYMYTYIHTYTYYISLYINFQGIIVMADIMYPGNPDKLHQCLNINLIYYYNFCPHKCSCTWGV